MSAMKIVSFLVGAFGILGGARYLADGHHYVPAAIVGVVTLAIASALWTAGDRPGTD